MYKNKKRKIFILINTIVPILIGAAIYYVISPDVLFVQKIDEILGYGIHINRINYDLFFIRFIRNYFLDMLWGYALVFALFLIVDNTAKIWIIFLIAISFSAVMEFLQLTSFVYGTFDIFDIVAEFIAELMAVIIIKIITFKEGKHEKS